MTARILQADVFDAMPTLAAGSVDAVVTSPPYWMLRSYLQKDHALKAKEMGSEKTVEEYISRMVEMFRLLRDAMAPHACAFVNIGDTYAGGGRSRNGLGGSGLKRNLKNEATRLECCANNKVFRGEGQKRDSGIPAGNLCLVPQRLALALQADRWLVRSVVMWHKPAPMPSSLSGWQWRRCRVKVKGKWGPNHPHPSQGNETGRSTTGTHSGYKTINAQWSPCPGCPQCEKTGGFVLRRGSWRPTSSYEPILMLAKSARYYADGDAVRTPVAASSLARVAQNDGHPVRNVDRANGFPDSEQTLDINRMVDPAGANLRDVWTIAAEPLGCGICSRDGCRWFSVSGAGFVTRGHKRYCPKCDAEAVLHYASFPSELVYRCLKASTSARGYCPHCGQPWARVVETKNAFIRRSDWGEGAGNRTTASGTHVEPSECTTLDWRPTCLCPPHDPRPACVLDPFCGSGRTGLECLRLGLDFVGLELNPCYAEMARRLLRDESPLFSGG